MRTVVLGMLLCLVGCGRAMDEPEVVMSASDALALPRPPADQVIAYGTDPLHFGELRVPEGRGPHPVAIVVHGGCWLAEYDLGYMSGLSAALRDAGVATWSIEYRRIGDDGGGWPGTLEDVAAAADFLAEIASEHDFDLGRVAAVGHSAGGHLALWLAGRTSLAADDPLRGQTPQPLRGVVAIAGIADLAAYAAPDGCGSAVPELLGGAPGEVPQRLRRASPRELIPLGVRQVLVTGALDPIVPPSHAGDYADAARAVGDPVDVTTVSGAGHFELIDPSHAAFVTVRRAVLELVSPKAQ
jgi:acetyl esterase/lipase